MLTLSLLLPSPPPLFHSAHIRYHPDLNKDDKNAAAKFHEVQAAYDLLSDDNKKAAYNYFFEEKFEAGMVLEGWEVKAAREGKVQLTDGYVVIREGELFLIGCQINPLHTASSHVTPDKVRTKKLLMKKDEIKRLIGKVEQKGHTLVPINLHWKNGKIKCEIALAKGKAEHDKRDTIKDREGKREVERAMKSRSR